MQVLREHYDKLLIALNGLDQIGVIAPIAHHETANNDSFHNFVEQLTICFLHVDIEGNTQFFFHRPPETALYYISCLNRGEPYPDEVIFKLTIDSKNAIKVS